MILAETHCGHLNAPFHGSKQGSSDVVDSVVSFSCDRGYRLQGSEERKCITNGTWDGVKADCVGQLYSNDVLDNLATWDRSSLVMRWFTSSSSV